MSETEANGHLFVFVHGLWGVKSHMNVIETSLKQSLKDLPDSFYYLNAGGFEFLNSYTGVEYCGTKVLDQVFTRIETLKAEEGVKIDKISFCGYSLGGLISRYCVGKMYELGCFKEIEPLYFTTFATPHLGVKFLDSNFFHKSLNFLGSRVFGKSGNDLFLTNSDVVAKMAKLDSPFMNGLKMFKMRVLLANTRNDRTVAFYTSFISEYSPFDDHPKVSFMDNVPGVRFSKRLIAPHIVDFEACKSGPRPDHKPGQHLLIRLVLLFYLPIFVPIVLVLTLSGTLYSHLLLRYGKRIDVNERWLKLNEYVYHGGKISRSEEENIEQSKHRRGSHMGDQAAADLTENAIEAIIGADDSRGAIDLEEASLLGSDSYEALDEFENLKLATPSYNYASATSQIKELKVRFRNTDLSAITKDPLPLDSQRKEMVQNLNSLEWYKIPIFIKHSLNAHGAIVGRRHEPEGVATTMLWANFIREDLQG